MASTFAQAQGSYPTLYVDGTPIEDDDSRESLYDGRLNRFATVAALPDGPTASFSWEAVYRVMTWPNDTAGRFHS